MKIAGGVFMSEWQPIETAPENEKVLLYCPFRHFTNIERIEVDYASKQRYFSNGKPVFGSGSHHAWATHWMPLPNPPKTINVIFTHTSGAESDIKTIDISDCNCQDDIDDKIFEMYMSDEHSWNGYYIVEVQDSTQTGKQ